MNDSHVPSISVSTKKPDGRCLSNYNHGLEVVAVCYKGHCQMPQRIDPLNTELNTICHLLALLGAHHIFHVSRIRVKRGDCYSKGPPTMHTQSVPECNFMNFLETVHFTLELNSNMTTPHCLYTVFLCCTVFMGQPSSVPSPSHDMLLLPLTAVSILL